jgi:serine/threonine protein kinase
LFAFPTGKEMTMSAPSKQNHASSKKELEIVGLPSKLIMNRYLLCDRIGSGSFGDVYAGIDKTTMNAVAFKVEQRTQKPQQLHDEHKVYKAISQSVGVPRVHFMGNNARLNVMIMDRLGQDLERLFLKCKRKFSTQTLCLLAIQMLDRIEHHHANGYVHRDLKPQNFVMGVENSSNANVVHLIDYGLCRKYLDAYGKHVMYSESHALAGTPRYVSINCHLGIQQTRRDDLESIAYVLLYFWFGSLPWQGITGEDKLEKYQRILNRKLQYTSDKLCAGAPSAVKEFLDYCRRLEFDECPDYEKLRALFRSEAQIDEQNPNTVIFDWSVNSTLQSRKKVTTAKRKLDDNDAAIESKIDPHKKQKTAIEIN